MSCNATGARALPSDPPAAPPIDQAVYRCGNHYSAQPCGETPAIDVADPRTEAQRLQGEDVAASDRHLAATLEAQRRAREAEAPPAHVRTAAEARADTTCARSPGMVAPPACPRKPPRLRRSRARGAAAAASAASAGYFTSRVGKAGR